jgi:hypothetical protein
VNKSDLIENFTNFDITQNGPNITSNINIKYLTIDCSACQNGAVFLEFFEIRLKLLER